MSRKFLLLFFIGLGIVMISCSKNRTDDYTPAPEVNQFVWGGMNSWYYWQENVPYLANSFKSDDEVNWHNHLIGYTPEDLFNSLLYERGNTDRFSWIVSDYEELNQQFAGVYSSFGFDFRLVAISGYSGLGYTPGADDIVAYITYVIPGDSPARDAGLKRGDIIWGVNGTTLDKSNYVKLLLQTPSADFNLMAKDDVGALQKSDKSVSLVSQTVSENPVHTVKVLELSDGRKVGYLKYNSFRHNYHRELVDSMQIIHNAGVDEMVLDLRYNGGGSILTAVYLATMMYKDNTGGTLINLNYNKKHDNNSFSIGFQSTIEILDEDYNSLSATNNFAHLDLDRLYVLTTSGTASASEMIINSLKPYMDVVVIGETTYGKNVGSVTLYDAPGTDFRDKSYANKSHTYAMQPIVSLVSNSLNESDFTHGFAPDEEVLEYRYLNDIRAFGDENEIVLNTALRDICPSCYSTPVLHRGRDNITVTAIDQDKKPLEKEMYLPDGKFDLGRISTRINVSK